MAKIKLGAIVVGMSGKLGGHVFATNKGGAYMRTKTTPLNPRSVLQTSFRAIFAQISALWGTLTEVQRNGWRAAVSSFAKTDVFGDIKNPTGKALFQRLNTNLENTGQAQITVAPMPAALTSADVTGVTGAVAIPALAVAYANATTGDKVIIYATTKLTQGTKFVKNKLGLLQVFAGAGAGTYDILASYQAKYGTLIAGDNIYIGLRTVNTIGMASPMQIVKAVISA